MSNIISWSKHLFIRRGFQILHQAVKMYKFHQTSFQTLLTRMFDILNNYDAKFTFPLTASTGLAHPSLVELLKASGNEIAIHGYQHLRYEFLPKKTQLNDIKKAVTTFKDLKIPYKGFRVPYNRYTTDTEELIDQFNFKWDGGIGYRMEYRDKHDFFNINLRNGKESSYTCIPLNGMSDDLLIDELKYSPKKVAETIIKEISKAIDCNGLVMFDLHPIRIAQRGYISSLEAILNFCRKKDVWVPNVSNAVEFWQKNRKWKHDNIACCLLTGDIDNFTFWDYLRRF